MFLIFDIAFVILSFCVHLSAFYLSFLIAGPIWADTFLSKSLSLAIGYFLFLNIFTIIIGLLRLCIQPRLHVGEFKIGMNKGYAGWVLNSLIQGIMISSPFHEQCQFFFYLKWIYYRLMGMKLPFSTLVGMKAIIRQPELIEVGKKSILGLGCTISCHYSPTSKIHIQEKVKIGDYSVLGGQAGLAPGVEVGNNSVIGAGTHVYPGCKVGNNVKIGADCMISFGTIIPDNVKIKSHTHIDKDCDIKEGDVWSGIPAKRIENTGDKK